MELKSRFHILMEKYAKDLLIEANTLTTMVNQGVVPAAFEYRKQLADSLASMKSIGIDVAGVSEFKVLSILNGLTSDLQNAQDVLAEVVAKVEGLEGDEQADVAGTELLTAMEKVRISADALEAKVADKYWPYPKYTELLF
ncbi:hypothetical protein HK098_007123 [Nowakowskiella sp. JEL0407]|nr:hypothetical protein HK098_007123 [Nowakowskiella sp. JEL0407]